MKVSAFKLGWVGIRVSKVGNASKILKRLGYFKSGPADLNNRNSFAWLRPGRTKAEFDAIDWRQLADAGLQGIAMWFTDAQWGHTAGITDVQWQDRRVIDSEFNAKWPTGKRP